jgi:Tfp pilus assembly protein PilV
MRLRSNEAGFGLVELIIAMTVLNVGLLALIAAMNSGALALSRASRVSTAAALAESHMELFRSLTYGEIRLDDTTLAADRDATYNADAAWNDTTDVVDVAPAATCASPLPRECDPRVELTGPDGQRYRVDTFIRSENPGVVGSGGTPVTARDVKVVTVVVRDATDVTRTFVRQQSTFDQSAG